MNKSTFRNRAQAGFTLIELIVVIVILGILAATALPKFTSLGGDARYASLQAAKGALSATAAMAKGKYLVNTSGTALLTLVVEGTTITYTTTAITGYPKADAGLAAAAGLSADYHVIVGDAAAVTDKAPAVPAGSIAIIPLTAKDTPTAVACHLLYAEPTVAGNAPTYTLVGSATACA
jgi:MSHA pilin protein MshA